MRIVRWVEPEGGEPRFGLWIEEMIADAGTARDLGLPGGSGCEALLERGARALLGVEARAVTRQRRPLGEVRLLAPMVRPSKILCLGLNYRSHAEEQNRPPPEEPMLFLKPPSAIAGPQEDIVIPPFCRHADPEVELALVVGRRAKKVKAREAHRHVAGYMVLNDFTDRRIQKLDTHYTRAKGFDTFCPIGPALVTKEELADPEDLAIRLFVDGELRQDARTSEMIHGIGEILEFVTRGITLEPGDIVATGTPGGVGVFRNPRVFVEEGQIVRCEIEGIGALENKLRRDKEEK